MENEQDNTTTGPNGKERKISCGTEKGKHKAKNHRTAGKFYSIKTKQNDKTKQGTQLNLDT